MLVAVLLRAAAPALAQPRDKPAKPEKRDGDGATPRDGKSKAPKRMDFSGLQFEGRLRTPQLLYFLDRAAEELERASLERRSFIPELVKSIDEEDL